MQKMKETTLLNEQLIALYERWYKQIGEKGFLADKYSNPYYCGVPNNWLSSKVRLMIVGEEGRGDWNKWRGYTYENIKELQNENLGFVNGCRNAYEENGIIKMPNTFKISSAFWQRFKQIEYLDVDVKINSIEKYTKPDVAVIWNNADKVCLKDENYAELSGAEREQLHSTDIKILMEEIKLLKPTHVVCFVGGNHIKALEKENVYNYSILDKNDRIKYYKTPLGMGKVNIKQQEVKMFYLYHPNYINKHKGLAEIYNKNIAKTIEIIKADLT